MAPRRWQLVEPRRPLRCTLGPPRTPREDEVVLEVAGCGACHTDLGFLDGEVRTRAPLPLVLGHEIAGTVCETGELARSWMGSEVVVGAVIPCGTCATCQAGRSNLCAAQQMPGNDCDGGFASHVTLPARGLVRIGPRPQGLSLAHFAVVADAVTTANQAVHRARLTDADVVVVIGAGGVGTYAVQLAALSGAWVVAVDVNPARLEPLRAHGAGAYVDAREKSPKDVRDAVRATVPAARKQAAWRIFECSGTSRGQEAAWAMLGPGATLGVVGFTREPVSVRLSNLMAFDADAFGSWGCPIERYAETVELVRTGRVAVEPFVRFVALDDIERVLPEVRAGSDPRRTVFVP
jgi:6-hydroxycyclohex-1-ene-1-carbonyl-CoA dehydrogenase